MSFSTVIGVAFIAAAVILLQLRRDEPLTP